MIKYQNMLQLKKQPKSLVFLQKHYIDGKNKIKSNSFNQEKETISSTLKTSSKKKLKSQKITLSMQEYQPEDNSKTWNHNLPSLKINTPGIKKSKTLVADSISKEKDLKPFWNTQIKELSEKLWLPTKTGSVVSDLKQYNGLLKVTEGDSWFSIERKLPLKKNSSTTSLLSSLYSQPVYTDSEATNLKSRKIQLYFSMKQKKIIKEWFGVYRWYYNRTIDLIKEINKREKIKNVLNTFFSQKLNIPSNNIVKKKSNYSEITLRNKLREKYRYNEKGKLPIWCSLEQIPSRIIDGAIRRCSENYLNNIKKLQSGLISSFTLKYKTKKDINQSIDLTKDLFSKTKNSFSLKYIGNYIRSNINFKGKIKNDTVLQYDKYLDTYHLTIINECRNDKQIPYSGVIALDPGERVFLTGYSPQTHTLEIGKGITSISLKFQKEIDILNSKKDKTKNKKRKKSFLKVIRRKNLRLKNLRDELHWKTINFLTKTYKTIMLGDLSVKSISSKKKNLNKKSKKGFSFLSLFQFRKRLEEKCKDRGNEFLFIDESYTTKTCTRCGNENKKIGSSKIFSCFNCSLETARDFNGARNIYLKGWFKLSEW